MAEGHPTIPRSFRALSRRVVSGILLTGVIASVSTLIPLYFYVEKSTDELALAYANAQAIAVQQQLEHYSAIGAQLSSRSYIRNLLVQYRAGQLDFEQLVQQSEPRLAHAAELIPELVMGYRLDRNFQLITRYVGPAFAGELPFEIAFEQLASKPLYYITASAAKDSDNTAIFITATAPIYDANNQSLIGADLLFFDSRSILKILHDLNRFGQQTKFQLVNTSENVYLQFNPDTQTLEHHQLNESHTINLAGYGSKPFVFHVTQESGQDLSHYFVPFEDSEWGLIAITPNKTLAYGIQAGLLWVFGAILLTAALGAYLIRHWLRPIIHSQIARTLQLKESNTKLRLANTVFEKTHEAIVITDARKLTIVRANQAVGRLFDTNVSQLKGRSLLDFVDAERVTEAMRDDVTKHITQHESWQGEVWYVRPTGSKFPALQTISPVRNSDGVATQLIHIFNDISSEKTAQKRIETLAMTDALTHLPNRFAVLHLLNEAIHNAEINHQHDFALLFIDLDKFKPVNDTYGHAVGDALLQAIGPRMKEALRANDVIGRLGGDEFVVIINQVKSRDDVKSIAEKLRKALQLPFRIGEITAQVGASVGIAFFPENGKTASALLSAADNAMYIAKQNGRQRYHIAEDE